MKRALLLILSVFALSGVGCGSKSSGGAAVPPATDPGAYAGSQCQPWQVYSTTYGCLNPGNCGVGYGYSPTAGGCVPGTVPSAITSGSWDNGITVTNVAKLREMLSDLGRCYQSNCPTANWAYLALQVSENNQVGIGQVNGWQQAVPGYNHSSAYHIQAGYNYGAPQSRQARVTLYTAGTYGYNNNLSFTSSAYPSEGGFEMRVNGVGHTYAYNERITFKFSYATADRLQLGVQVIYKGVVVAQGTINKI
jgi:hypothetical protein